jgi:hypothetical protein
MFQAKGISPDIELERLEQAIRVAVPDWSLADLVTALMAMRGIDLISAATFWPRSETSRGFNRLLFSR